MESVYELLIKGSVHPALESYDQGSYVVNWMVDEDPTNISFLDTSRVKGSSKGYYNKDGWVSFRGRFFPYPRAYHARDVVKNLQKERERFYWVDEKAPRYGNYIRLIGNIFSDHNNQNYPRVNRFFVYVNAKEWDKMSKEDQWDYMRDICTNGYKTNYSTRKSQENKLRAVLKKALWQKAFDSTKEGNLKYFPTEFKENPSRAKEYYDYYVPLIERSLHPYFYEETIHCVSPYVYNSVTLCYPWYNNPEWIDFKGNNDLELENERARQMRYPTQTVRHKARLYQGFYLYSKDSVEDLVRKGYLVDITPPLYDLWLSRSEIIDAYGEDWFKENLPVLLLKINR